MIRLARAGLDVIGALAVAFAAFCLALGVLSARDLRNPPDDYIVTGI